MNQKPTKNCLNCGRPFTWRKKWKANWDRVLYCSKRCRSEKPNSKRLSSELNDARN
ncbi:MAG: DUF2256 domain-containing protein [Planctomycetota bacterium]|nr:DUF2256 domain-containing protein [Planctomycetota bacterium]